MKILTSILIVLIVTASAAGQSAFEWANVCGHPYYSETRSFLAPDPYGHLIMAGNFIDTAYFGSDYTVSKGQTDLFMARHDPEGGVMWLLSDGGSDYDYLQGIVADEEGIFACMTFYGSTQIGDSIFNSAGSQDIVLARYDLDGNFIWATHMGSPKTDYANAIDSDINGNLLLTGHFYDSIAFSDTTVYAVSSSDIFLASFTAAGGLAWVRTLGGSSSDQSYSLSCDDNGNVLLSGSFFNDIQITDTILTTEDPTGVFLARYTHEGQFNSAWQLDGNGLLSRSFASYDTEGNILHAGNFTDQLSLGPYLFDAGPFNVDIYVSKYDPDGGLLWADHAYSFGSDQLVSVSSGPENELYLTGHFLDTIHFGDITLKYTLCCGSAEIFVVNYTSDGTAAWGRQLSGVTAMVEDICTNHENKVFLAGMFSGELQIEDMKIESEYDFSNYLTGLDPDLITGLDDPPAISDPLYLYPNPAQGMISLEMRDENRFFTWEIIDPMGRVMLKGSAIGTTRISVSSLRNGIHYMRITDNQGSSFTETFMVKN